MTQKTNPIQTQNKATKSFETDTAKNKPKRKKVE